MSTTRDRYDARRDLFKSGDLLLFSGKGLISRTVRWMTSSRWSHVGLVLRVEVADLILVWESTGLSKVPDMDAGVPLMGVQLVPLSERLRDYDGDVAVRALSTKLSDAQETALWQLRKTFRGRPYEQHKLDLLKAAMGTAQGDDLSSLFCSEMVAAAYQAVGLLPSNPPADDYVPADFSAEVGTVDHRLTAGVTLDLEDPL